MTKATTTTPMVSEALVDELRTVFAAYWERTEDVNLGSVLTRLMRSGKTAEALAALRNVK